MGHRRATDDRNPERAAGQARADAPTRRDALVACVQGRASPWPTDQGYHTDADAPGCPGPSPARATAALDGEVLLRQTPRLGSDHRRGGQYLRLRSAGAARPSEGWPSPCGTREG